VDAARLTRDEASAIYRRRWDVEVCFRKLKQTLGHDRMASRTPSTLKTHLVTRPLIANDEGLHQSER
jgi:hypothetical protein